MTHPPSPVAKAFVAWKLRATGSSESSRLGSRLIASKLAAPSMTTGMPVCCLEVLPGFVGHRPAVRRHRNHDARVTEHRMRLQGAGVEDPVVGRHIDEVHAVPALLDGDGGRHEGQRRKEGKRPIGSGPARGREYRAHQRRGTGARGNHPVAGHPETVGETFLELGR